MHILGFHKGTHQKVNCKIWIYYDIFHLKKKKNFERKEVKNKFLSGPNSQSRGHGPNPGCSPFLYNHQTKNVFTLWL